MKTVGFSRIAWLVGLALGAGVLWTVAAPIAAGDDSVRGALPWDPYTGQMCCSDLVESDCSEGQVTGFDGCDSGPLWIIIVPGSLIGEPIGSPVCTGPGNCNNVCDSHCGDVYPDDW